MSETEGRTTASFEVTATPPERQIEGDHYANIGGAAVAQLAQLDIDALTTSVRTLVDQMALTFRPREGGPAETEVEFGLKVTAEGSVIVSKLGGEVSMRVKVRWDRS